MIRQELVITLLTFVLTYIDKGCLENTTIRTLAPGACTFLDTKSILIFFYAMPIRFSILREPHELLELPPKGVSRCRSSPADGQSFRMSLVQISVRQ